MKCLLVTGATGFIGRHCLPLLVNAGFDKICAVSRSGQGPSANGLTWHAADLRDAGAAARIVAATRPTHLFHAAWIATPGIYLSSPENVDWLQAGIALVRAFAEQGGERYVGVGSCAEYGITDLPCDEDLTPLRPASLYGQCKLALWDAVQAFAHLHNMDAAWGRVFLPYGPGDPPARLIPAALTALLAGSALPLSQGDQLRDFIYAPDAAVLLVGLLNSAETGAFNIGTGEARSVRSVLEAIADRLGARGCLRFGERPLRPGEPDVLVANIQKLRARLHMQAYTPMAEALDHLIDLAKHDVVGLASPL